MISLCVYIYVCVCIYKMIYLCVCVCVYIYIYIYIYLKDISQLYILPMTKFRVWYVYMITRCLQCPVFVIYIFTPMCVCGGGSSSKKRKRANVNKK